MFSPILLLSMLISLPNWVWSETSVTFVVVVFADTMNAILVLSIVPINGNCDLLILNILASNITIVEESMWLILDFYSCNHFISENINDAA